MERLLVARHYPRCYVFKLYPKDGNVSLYEVNTEAVARMFLPQSTNTLSNIIAIIFIGTRRLPTKWLSQTFQVRRWAVYEALQWLQANNELYHDIEISAEL